jgi:hypothetical protein
VENALRAMDLVMDDRPADAQKVLENGTSSFDKVCTTIIYIIESFRFNIFFVAG